MEKSLRRKFTKEEKEIMLAKTKGRCAHCGKKLTLDTMTVEHLYPLDKGGDNSEYNTIALCHKCNVEKSNWVYDLSYFGYIANPNDVYRYTYKLMNYIYNDNNDTNIFGRCNRICYYLPVEYCEMLNSKKLAKDRTKIARALGKKIEIKQLYRGDLDKDALELIRHEYVRYDDNWNPTDICVPQINENFLQIMFRTSTFYGVYFNEKIVGVTSFTNIEHLKVHDETFKQALYDRGYNKAYVVTIMAFADNYKCLVNSIGELIREYTGITNNAILFTYCDYSDFFRFKMKGIKTTYFEIIEGRDFLLEENGENSNHSEYLALNEHFDNYEEAVAQFRKAFNKNKELFENTVQAY